MRARSVRVTSCVTFIVGDGALRGEAADDGVFTEMLLLGVG